MMYFFALVFLTVPAILEGAGIRLPTPSLYIFYYCAFLTIPYLLMNFKNMRLYVAPKLTIVSVLFVLLAAISSFFTSLDKQVSFEKLLFVLFLMSLFIIVNSNKKEFTQLLKTYIPVATVFFLTTSLIALVIKSHSPFSPLIPITEKQVIIPIYGSHNHLGDFLAIPLIAILVTAAGMSPFHFSSLFAALFIPFALSGSRSAYLSFSLVLILFLVHRIRSLSRFYLFVAAIGLTIMIVGTFIVSSKGILSTKTPGTFSRVVEYAQHDMFSERIEYLRQSLSSIKAHPFFGIGLDNFIYASHKYNYRNTISDSAHNLFAEMAVATGIPASICFFLMMMLVGYQAIKHKGLAGYVFLFLLLNFQTDYTYQLYLLLVLFAISAALVYEEQKSIEIPLWTFGLANVLFMGCLFLVVTSMIFVKTGNYEDALSFYPFNKWAYIYAIQSESPHAEEIIRKAEAIAPYDKGLINVSGRYYLDRNDKKRALTFYEKAYAANNYLDFTTLKTIYLLKRDVGEKEEAETFLKSIIRILRVYYPTDSLKKEVADFCIKEGNEMCKGTGWYRKTPDLP